MEEGVLQIRSGGGFNALALGGWLASQAIRCRLLISLLGTICNNARGNLDVVDGEVQSYLI